MPKVTTGDLINQAEPKIAGCGKRSFSERVGKKHIAHGAQADFAAGIKQRMSV
ncbi:hypothetical protein ACLED1_03810 [Lonsdalea quercina]|uniref:hypothetical protein n=1 Tax=Lonsdalea quercina TaxID=71657 RepID=UPI0039749B46